MSRHTAIAGIGATRYTRRSERSVMALAVEAVTVALADAGLTVGDVDGVVTYALGDSVSATDLAREIGVSSLRLNCSMEGGGYLSCASVAVAAAAVEAGLAKTVVCFRAMNGRSGKRLGGSDRLDVLRGEGRNQYTVPLGVVTYAQQIAFWARRHMELYGTTEAHLGAVAVTQRDMAVRNESAMMREPITLDDYFASQMVVEPFRVLDICLENDGACAVVVTSAQRAADTRAPVQILAAVQGSGPIPADSAAYTLEWPDLATSWSHYLREELFARAGVIPTDIDVACLYDCFTFAVISQLEGFGFCKPGDGGPYAASGALSLTGELPVNPHGGLLSEAYIHGLNHVVEAVHQLRGEAAARQVPRAEVALVSGGSTASGSALVLGATR